MCLHIPQDQGDVCSHALNQRDMFTHVPKSKKWIAKRQMAKHLRERNRDKRREGGGNSTPRNKTLHTMYDEDASLSWVKLLPV